MRVSRSQRPVAGDLAPWLGEPPRRPPRVRSIRRSLHVPMRDRVRLAVDVHLPDRAAAGPGLPAIVRQTRYFRGVQFREPFGRLGLEWLLDHADQTRRRFLAAGYAWVDVCVRGSGASFGSRPCPWSPDEIADGADVVDWIIAQPWSNGIVGATGVSYDGTASDFLLVNGHPAVRAIVPRFSLWDVFPDVAFPGGIHLSWFTAQWSRFNRALDANDLDRAFARMIRIQLRALRDLEPDGPAARLSPLLTRLDTAGGEALARRLLSAVATGVRPVDGDRDGALLAAAVAAHRENFDVHEGARQVTFRDDAGVSSEYPDANIDLFSPHAHAGAIRASSAAIYSYSGWLDAAYQHAAIKRFNTVQTPGSRLILGPWDHGGLHDVSPFSRSARSAFDHDGEMVRFFDRTLRGAGAGAGDPAVRYFTMGEERWKTADRWPPPHVRPRVWHLSDRRTLSPEPPRERAIDEHRIDREVGTGPRSRWVSLLGLLPPVGYRDRAALSRRLLVYRAAPLDAPLEVTGQPIVTLRLAADATDAQVFAYLEDEHPDGRVDYVTEGQLRALHRKEAAGAPPYRTGAPWRTFARADASPLTPNKPVTLRFPLLPISWLFFRDHRLRLAIAGADADHFDPLEAGPRTLAIHRGPEQGSTLVLPTG